MGFFSFSYALSAIVALPTLLLIMRLFTRKDKFVVEGRTILITGASQGMGLSVARMLASKGANILLAARDESKLELAKRQVAAAAKSPSTQRFHWISADVTSEAENQRLLRETTEWNHGEPPDVVWQIAGSAHPALFLETPIEVMKRQMDLNYWAACYLAHAVLGVWTTPPSATAAAASEPPPRHFVMTSSLAIMVGLAGYAPYSPAKTAMRNLAEVLRNEMALYNGARFHDLPAGTAPASPAIKVHLITPGTILSPGYENEEKTKHAVTRLLEEDDTKQTADQVAARAIAGLERGDYMISTHLLGDAMRVAALGGSPRNGLFGIRDALLGCLTAFAWLFVVPDLERKVWGFGKKHGVARGSKS